MLLLKIVTILTYLEIQRVDNIMSDELEIRMTNPMLDISLGTSEKVVGDGDTMSLEHEPIDEVRADEPGAACH